MLRLSLVLKPGENDFKPNSTAIAHRCRPRRVVIARTGGGGGWGDPLERETRRVRDDVLDDFVSRDAAEKFYGVIVKDDFSIDEAATKAQRTKLKAERQSEAAE